MEYIKFVQTFVFVLTFALTTAYNYCFGEDAKKLCIMQTHFLCLAKTIPPYDILLAEVPMTRKLKEHILHEHNFYRNELAGGQVHNVMGVFPHASRLRVLIWDEELAYISKVHVKNCHMTQDQCVNTPRFPNVGQNIDVEEIIMDVFKAISNRAKQWFSKQKIIRKPSTYPNGIQITWRLTDKFVRMIHENTSRVGCALSYCKDVIYGNIHKLYITCSYDFTNMRGHNIYFSGKGPAMGCTYWKSKRNGRYPNLCNNS